MLDGKSNYSDYLNNLDKILDEYLVKKAPGLPEAWKNFIVKILPWLIIIFLVITIPAVLAAFGLSFLVLPATVVPIVAGIGFVYILSVGLMAIGIVLEIMALPGLFSKSATSWKLLYYCVLVGALGNIITLNIFGLIIGTLLSLYILFQIRSYYK